MLRLYNTLTRREEEFAPSQDNVVRMYACGPTVYARAHIGNFRYFVCVDVLRRELAARGGVDPSRLRVSEGAVPVEASGQGRVEFEIAS